MKADEQEQSLERADLVFRFPVPKGKVSSILGMLNFLQSRYASMGITLHLENGSLTDQEYDEKIEATLQQLGVRAQQAGDSDHSENGAAQEVSFERDPLGANVGEMLDTLLQKLDAEIAEANQFGAKAFEAGNHVRAKELLARAEEIAAYRRKVASLRKQWGGAAIPNGTGKPTPPSKGTSPKPRVVSPGRGSEGRRPGMSAYYVPILQALDQLGGSAEVARVLSRVEESMRGILTEIDYTPTPSKSNVIRWKHRTHWAYNRLRHDGLAKPGSRRGVWEITDEGRMYLKGKLAAP
jgi:restriction system protein